MEKLLLVDGSNLLFQMFYGMPSRIINKKGKPIQGTLGFIGALLKIIKEIQPTLTCVFFDGEHSNPRKELLPEYKTNRIDYTAVPEEDSPFSQLPDIYSALNYMKIPFIELKEFETDDYIAAYTLKYQNLMEIYIASWDSDFFSLINERVTVYRYKGKQSYYCTPTFIQQKLHILPEQYIFFKSLVGDKSDYITGIPKIGPITASKIVSTYSSISDLYQNGQKEPYFKYLLNKKSILERNYQLISFYQIRDYPFTLKELALPKELLSTHQVLKAIGLMEY